MVFLLLFKMRMISLCLSATVLSSWIHCIDHISLLSLLKPHYSGNKFARFGDQGTKRNGLETSGIRHFSKCLGEEIWMMGWNLPHLTRWKKLQLGLAERVLTPGIPGSLKV